MKLKILYQLYCNASGAKINKKKSEVILFQPDDKTTPFDLKNYTLKRYTKYLGILIGHDIPSNLTWEPLLKKVIAIISYGNQEIFQFKDEA